MAEPMVEIRKAWAEQYAQAAEEHMKEVERLQEEPKKKRRK